MYKYVYEGKTLQTFGRDSSERTSFWHRHVVPMCVLGLPGVCSIHTRLVAVISCCSLSLRLRNLFVLGKFVRIHNTFPYTTNFQFEFNCMTVRSVFPNQKQGCIIFGTFSHIHSVDMVQAVSHLCIRFCICEMCWKFDLIIQKKNLRDRFSWDLEAITKDSCKGPAWFRSKQTLERQKCARNTPKSRKGVSNRTKTHLVHVNGRRRVKNECPKTQETTKPLILSCVFN